MHRLQMITGAAGILTALALSGCEQHERANTVMAADDIVYEGQSLTAVRDWASGTSEKSADSARPDRNVAVAPVGDMLEGLEARLEANPDDVKGWSLLAQSYAFTGRMQDANEALERAVELGADRPALEARVLKAHTEQR
ncbi:MAG: hypothetical protein AAGE85_05305 [Pseudomonadota bacterium]